MVTPPLHDWLIWPVTMWVTLAPSGVTSNAKSVIIEFIPV